MIRRLLAIGWSMAVFVPLIVAACASPTLPLPPPGLPTQAVGVDADHVSLSATCGGAEPSAIVIILNTNPAVANDKAVSGTIASTCGAWDASVFAHKGDELQITQDSDTMESPGTTYVVE